MVYCFDIDGTICSNTYGEYEKAEPFPEMIRAVNELHGQGHTIYFLTARGGTSGADWRIATERQLREWSVRYHKLFFGKPPADKYVDDCAINVTDFRRDFHIEDSP